MEAIEFLKQRGYIKNQTYTETDLKSCGISLGSVVQAMDEFRTHARQMKREEIIKEAEKCLKSHELGKIDFGSNPAYYTPKMMIKFAADFLIQQIGKEQPDTEVEDLFDYNLTGEQMSDRWSSFYEIKRSEWVKEYESQKQQWDRERGELVDKVEILKKEAAYFLGPDDAKEDRYHGKGILYAAKQFEELLNKYQ